MTLTDLCIVCDLAIEYLTEIRQRALHGEYYESSEEKLVRAEMLLEKVIKVQQDYAWKYDDREYKVVLAEGAEK